MGRVMESMHKFYRIAALGTGLLYVAVVHVPFTLVLIIRRVLAEVEIPANGRFGNAAGLSDGVKEGLAIESRAERR
jgi:hypothetical protein